MAEMGLPVVVRFPAGFPSESEGPALLLMEIALRTATKLDVRVVKDLMGDDSKLRRMMTLEQREKL